MTMKIQAIQSNQSFTGNPHFISNNAHKDLATILVNLNRKTVTKFNGDFFHSEIPNTLRMGEKTTFYDKRYYMMPAPADKQIVGSSELALGKINLLINNRTGEVIKCKKPFLTRWKKVLKKAESALKTFKEELDNSNVVEKQIVKVSGMTKDGIKSLEQF